MNIPKPDMFKEAESARVKNIFLQIIIFYAVFYERLYKEMRKMGRASSCGRHACEPAEPAGETLKV